MGGPIATHAAGTRCLWRQGWRTSVRVPHWSLAGYVMGGQRLTCWNPDGQVLNLLWQWDRSDRSGRFPGDVWERTGQGRLANVPVLTLDAADAVHDLCRQAPAGSCFTQMVDLLLLVDAMPGPLDWSRLFARAAHAPLDPGWRECVVRLHTVLPHSLPSSAVLDWPALEMPPAAPARGGMRARMAAHWAAYREALGARSSMARAFRQLPGYLLARWDLPALQRIPPRLWRGLRYEWREARLNGK